MGGKDAEAVADAMGRWGTVSHETNVDFKSKIEN